MPVHLYGHPADMDPILALARERGLAVLEDACQAHGALYEGRPVGTLAGERASGALSFYPTKNLGGARRRRGDPGERPEPSRRACASSGTAGRATATATRSPGVNSRLDELQAALAARGPAPPLRLDREAPGARRLLRRERSRARAWSCRASSRTPARSSTSSWCATRGATPWPRRCGARGVGTLIHYPIPLHLQPAFASLGGKPGDLPVAEKATDEILSLPLYPELSDEQARAVAAASARERFVRAR